MKLYFLEYSTSIHPATMTGKIYIPLLLLCLVLPHTAFSAFPPIIGIPTPLFGVDESHTMYAGQQYNYGGALGAYKDAGNGPYTHYIDSTNVASTDDNNDYGSPSKPRKTIPPTVPEGSVIEVHNGMNTNGFGEYIMWGAGTAEKPIFYRGINSPRLGSGKTDIGYYANAKYIIVEGFSIFSVIIPGRQEGTVFTTSNIAVRNCEITGDAGDGGVRIYSNTSNTVKNIVVYNNTIHENGDWLANYDQDVHGVGIFPWTSYVWVIDNTIYHNSGDGVQVVNNGVFGAPYMQHHIYIGRNVSHHNKQTGMWTKTASDIVFSQNTIYGHRPSDSSGGQGMGYQYDPKRVWYLFNTVYDNTLGIGNGSVNNGGREDVYMIGNVIYNNISSGIQINGGDETVEIVNNTLFNNPKGIENGYYQAKINITNNIISGGATHIYFPSTYITANNSNVVNTLFDSHAVINWNDVIRDVSSMQSIGKCPGCAEGNSLFINQATNNFDLTESSPSIDKGIVHTGYARFETLYGIDIKKDKTGRTRPSGSAWDMGAYEYTKTSKSGAPSIINISPK